MEEQKNKKNWHDNYYKLLLIIPAAILLFSFIYLGIFYYHNDHSFIKKDISLRGGTSITVYDQISASDLESALQNQLDDLTIREISDLITGEQKAITVETTTDAEKTKSVLEDYLGYTLISGQNADIISTGASFGESFYKQLLIGVLFAFLFMAIVVFILFRTGVPSLAVILSAFADIIMTLVTVNLLGIKMSGAGIIALIMLIGYSVDTDILLTNRILKRNEGTLNSRIYGAFKTGMTMTLTSLFAMGIALFVVKSFSETLTQIFTILVIGLGFDIFNTWITNVSILKWYAKSKGGLE
jgi:preprotein translocase subunit SecF